MSLETLSAVWDLDLERNEKDVLEVLAWHANAEGVCWPSKARIMYKTGLSESTVKRALKNLKETGLITVEAHAEGGRGKTPLYKVHSEKGVRKPPFEEWIKELKGVSENGKRGSEEAEKGVRAVNPEPTQRTAIEPNDEESNASSSADSPRGKGFSPHGSPPESAQDLKQYAVTQLMERVEAARSRGAPIHDPLESDKRQYGRFFATRAKRHDVDTLLLAFDYMVAKASGEIEGEPKAWCGFDTALDHVTLDGWRPPGGSPASEADEKRLAEIRAENDRLQSELAELVQGAG